MSRLMLRTLTSTALVAAAAVAATPAVASTVTPDQTYVVHNVLSGAPNNDFHTRFEFEGDSRIAGTYGCNSFAADYVAANGTITFTNYEVTERHCYAYDSNESYYPTFFTGTHRFSHLDGRFVTITADNGDKLYAFSE